MHIFSLVTMAVIGASVTTCALAQSAVQGPLGAPSVAAKSAKPKHRKPIKIAHHANPPTASPAYGAVPPPPTEALPVAHSASPTDPVDFGMKWNGSSDSARETRVQNYNGDAEGTGAQVGMKLHF